jgi:hypothetical protein
VGSLLLSFFSFLSSYGIPREFEGIYVAFFAPTMKEETRNIGLDCLARHVEELKLARTGTRLESAGGVTAER